MNETLTVDGIKVHLRADAQRFERKRRLTGDARALRDLVQALEIPEGDKRQDRMDVRQALCEQIVESKALGRLFPPPKATRKAPKGKAPKPKAPKGKAPPPEEPAPDPAPDPSEGERRSPT